MRVPALICLLLLLGKVCSAALPPVTDAAGVRFSLPTPCRRIVSLAPGTTEMLFALGLGKRVVGDTTYCDYPPAARAIAKIGDVAVNYEKVVALHPDLVVATDANLGAASRLKSLGVHVLTLKPTSYSAVERSLNLLGQVTGTQAQARRVVGGMEAARAAALRAIRAGKRHPTVLAVIGLHPLFVAGGGTFIDDLIQEAGGRNGATETTGYAAYSTERVLTHPPDYVLADAGLQAQLRADAILRVLPAVRSGRFIVINADILNRPGPRLADALKLLAQSLNPGTP